ncbi:FecR family protein [Mucilaginibacter sp. L196]|uniref:FecR family protein n=1 Tax=Mucilaginibacter sp. L196 TaxID=1641870 RepID=UPI00131D9B52|nr:FecR family protein [Mucilaginibacter sp. L196]
MDNQQAKQLLTKYINGGCTSDEKCLVESWYLKTHNSGSVSHKEIEESMKIVQMALPQRLTPVHKLWPRIVGAASIFLFLSIGGYFLAHKRSPRQITQNKINDIGTVGNKAILKLANGQQLLVTDAKKGLLVQQVNTRIIETKDGRLTYNNTTGNVNGNMLYDTLIVPRGEQHQVKFADGSIAYLDADTKLRIPENFNGSDRTVELISGQALFHVVHNSVIPFRVKVKGQITQDIGTEFNINAYTDEPGIKTTLIEGSVEVLVHAQTTFLKPGQQIITQNGNKSIKVKNVDLEEVMSWKNGFFDFNNEDLESIMRKVSRCYNVDIIYTDNSLKSQLFSGMLSRFKNVSQLLKKLELTGAVHFKVQGQKIIVSK